SAPGMLHAGAPTPLAVTLFSDSSASVTAECFSCSLQLPGSIPHNSLLKLNVWGNKDNQIVFTNTTNVTFSHRNVSSFIQTDRSSYRPGHTIKIRVVSLQLDNHPYRGKLKISLQASHYSLNLVEFQVPKNVFLNVGSDEGLYELHFLHFSQPLKPSLDFSARVSEFSLRKKNITRYDKSPLSLEELLTSAVVEVTQSDASKNAKNTTLMFPVSENGTVNVQFKLQEQIATLFIVVREVQSECCFIYFKVSSKGQVVAAGTKNSSTFSLTPDLSWSPLACVTVYCLTSDGELISHSVFIPIQKPNLVTLNWSKEKAQPGEEVSLTVATTESKVQVGIVVTGTDSNTLQSAPDSMLEQVCRKLMLVIQVIMTSTFITMTNIFCYTGLEKLLMINKRKRIQTLKYKLLRNRSKMLRNSSTSEKITVPGGVTSLGAFALVMSENLGLGFTPVPQKLTVSKDFSLSVVAPPHIIRGEEIVLEAKIFNYLEHMSVINAKQFTIGSRASGSALFPIEPLVLGETEISVEAISMDASDSIVWKLMVKPEGIEQSSSQTLFLELAPQSDSNSRSISFSFPPHVVPGSQMARVSLCPSTQLSYQRDDGSFSAFGKSDASGSTWLTAFVLRCFLQAQTYIQVDQDLLIRALMWLLQHQGPQGQFLEVGRLIHTEMQGGMDDSSVALTAFVLVEKYASNVSLALNYLENKLSSGVVSNYSLSLVAYALARGNRPLASRALSELRSRADNIDGVMMWTPSAGLNSHDLSRPQSAQIEMAAYVLLALFVRGSFIEGIALMKWLSIQRNHLGGFGTTQDTVIALQALAYYAAFSGANAINVKIDLSLSGFLVHLVEITHRGGGIKSYKLYLIISCNRFYEFIQLNVFYNVENQTFLQSPQQASDEEAFSLNIRLSENSNHSNMILSVCTRLKDNQIIPNTGMVIVDVGMLSGLGLLPEATFPSDLVRKVESTPEKVLLYLDSVRLNKTEVCIRFPIVRNYKVARVRDAMVLVYDYYEPTRRAQRTYNSETLYSRESCSFCGENCNLCQSGIYISSTHSLAADDRTFCWSVLFLGAAASLFVV
uniref:CD109 molecule n=1 Tax=Oryzias melastigma TaxID=30732 RepID=A0A3B3DP73_ORYME